MNDLEVRYKLIEGDQGRSCFRFHHRLLRLRSGEPADGLHRLPQREHDKFNRAANRALEQVCSAMSFDRSECREDLFGCVLNVLPRFLDGRSPLPHAQDHALAVIFIFNLYLYLGMKHLPRQRSKTRSRWLGLR